MDVQLNKRKKVGHQMNELNQTNQTNETSEVVSVNNVEQTFTVAPFDALQYKLDVENFDIEATKANKLSTLMQAKMDLFTSNKPMDEMLKLDAELTNQIIAIQNSGKMTLESVINNNAKFVLCDGVLYRFDSKQVRTASSAIRTTSTKVSGNVHKEKWYGKQIGFKHNGVVIPLGDVAHIEAQCQSLGMAISVYLAHVIKQNDVNFDAKKGIPGWSNSNLTEIQ